MIINLRKCIGKSIERIFLEWYYFNDQPCSIIRLYIKVDLYFDITCCEESISIREQKEIPTTVNSGDFTYKLIQQDMYDYLRQHTDANENHMRPQSNNSGARIQQYFTRQQRFDALKGFYDNYPIRYWDAKHGFYRNNHIMRQWRPW